MPKLFGTNILIILLAGFLFFMLGWLWFGILFGDAWMALAGVTEETASENMGRSLIIGLLLSILQATGIAAILSMASERGISKGLKVGFLVWLLFALPTLTYDWNYAISPFQLLVMDAGYQLLGYLLMGAVLAGLHKKN